MTTAPSNVPESTTAAQEIPLLNVTVQIPVTIQLPVSNVTIPPTVEETTNITIDKVTEAPENEPPAHPGIV